MMCNTVLFLSRLSWKCFKQKLLNIFEDVCSSHVCFSADLFWLLRCVMHANVRGRFWATQYILEKFSLYFTHLPKSSQQTDLHEFFHRGSSHGRNHLFQILFRLADGFRIYKESNFAILHWYRAALQRACDTSQVIVHFVSNFVAMAM